MPPLATRFPLAPLAFAALCVFAISPAAAQSTDLAAQVRALVELVAPEVRAGDDDLLQALEPDPDAPYVATYTLTELGKRGEDVTTATIDFGQVRRASVGEASRGRLPVRLVAEPGAAIVVVEDDRDPDYEQSVELLADGRDNAKALAAAVNALLPAAKTAYAAAAALPSDVAGLQAYVAERVATVRDGDDEYVQSLAFDAEGRGTLEVDGSGVRDEPATYTFRLLDLQPRGLEVDDRGALLELTAPTPRGRAFVAVASGGERAFERELTLRFDDYETAQRTSRALAELITLARDQKLGAITQVASREEALRTLGEAIGAPVNDEVGQSFAGDCAAVVTVEESGRSSSEVTLALHLGDLNPRGAEMTARQGIVQLTVPTAGGGDFVQRTEDGEADGYDDELELRFAEVTGAERALDALGFLAEACAEARPTPEPAELLTLATRDDLDGGAAEQTFAADDKPCAYVLTLLESRGSRSSEATSRFNLADLDARSAELNVRGDEVEVEYGTARGQDVVEVTDEGGDLDYDDGVAFRFASVDDARSFMAGMASAIEGCE